MSPAERHEILWTETAVDMLARLGDRRIQQQLFDASKRLEREPEKQGRPLREGLLGYRSLRAVGQRYRLIYSLDVERSRVIVVAAGLRREGARDDVYELAQRIVRLGLAPVPRRAKAKPTRVRRKRKRN